MPRAPHAARVGAVWVCLVWLCRPGDGRLLSTTGCELAASCASAMHSAPGRHSAAAPPSAQSDWAISSARRSEKRSSWRRVLITSTGLSAAVTAAVETPPHATSASKSGITLAPPRRAKFAERGVRR
eukprot:scaffold24140_cov51-Phaeocystis_antarctica.AAC.1